MSSPNQTLRQRTKSRVVRSSGYQPQQSQRSKWTTHQIVAERRRNMTVIDDFHQTLLKVVASPAVIFSTIVAAVIAFTHLQDPSKGAMHSLLDPIKNTQLHQWAFANINKSLGLITLVPLAFCIQSKDKMLYLLGCVVLVVILPPLQIFHYAMMVVCVVFFKRAALSETRAVMLMALAVYGYCAFNNGGYQLSEGLGDNPTRSYPLPRPRESAAPNSPPRVKRGNHPIYEDMPDYDLSEFAHHDPPRDQPDAPVAVEPASSVKVERSNTGRKISR